MQTFILFWGIITSFLFPNLTNIKTIDKNINILILGKAGGAHEGPDLTDTMILVTVNTQDKRISTISIPRDLWLPDLKTKINATYFYGKQDMVKKSVSDIFGTEVDYSVIVDFSGFESVIDAVGGIEIDVENEFTDNRYPIVGKENDLCDGDRTYKCRYETISFEKGKQKMDGSTALKFVRSRHAEGLEGTDTARQVRQQKVIDALKDKLTNPKTYLNIKKSVQIYNSIMNAVEVDFDLKTGSVITRKIFDARGDVKNYIIPEGLLVVPKVNLNLYDNQYVFIPKLGNGNWEDLQKWYTSILKR